MAYDIALIVGIFSISFMIAYIANSFPNDRFLLILKFFMWGSALWILMFIPALELHIVNESNATGIIVQNTDKMVNATNSLSAVTMWLFVALSFMFIAYAIWLMGNKWKRGKEDDI